MVTSRASQFERNDVVVQTRPSLTGISAFVASASLLYAVVVVVVGRHLGIVANLVLGAAFLAASIGTTAASNRWRMRRWRARHCTVNANASGLWIDGRRKVRGGSGLIAGTVVEEDDSPGALRFGRSLRVVLADEEDRSALLEAMGLGVSRVVALYYFGAGPRRKQVVLVILLIAVAFLCASSIFFNAAVQISSLAAFSFVAFALIGTQTRAEVAADGVRIRGPFARKVFLPYSRLRNIEVSAGELTLHMGDAERIVLSFAGGRTAQFFGKDGADTARAFVDRIERYRRMPGSSRPSAESLLARGTRMNADWLTQLRRVGANRGYRSIVVPSGELLRIVEDPGALPTARAGAAVALRPSVDRATRARIRSVAALTGASNLKDVFLAVADGADETEIEAGAGRVEDYSSRRI